MKISLRKVLIFILVFASLIPHVGMKISILGFNWTLYRGAVILSAWIFLLLPRYKKKLTPRNIYKSWIYFLSVWILYGTLLLFISPYRNLHGGIIELISIFSGFICLAVLLLTIRDVHDLNQIINIVQFIFIILVIWGGIECITGIHLPMSYFNDDSINNLLNPKLATGIFYSENDFSAFLTCLLPVMFYRRKLSILTIFTMIGVVYIDYINDANICLLALLAAIGYYLIFIHQYVKKGRRTFITIFVSAGFILCFLISKNLKSLAKFSPLLNTIYVQYSNFNVSQGSMYDRLIIYADSVKASIQTFFLGVGPASFSNYFYKHPSSSGLVNPHNLYLEILLEYGIVIAVIFVWKIVSMIKIISKNAIVCKSRSVKWKYISCCEMLFIYCIVCIASSSFIGYAWQWVVIALGVIHMVASEEELVDINR